MALQTRNKGFKKRLYNVVSQRLKETPLERRRFLHNLGRVIREARRQVKMTQEELGELAEVNPKYLGEVELGKTNPSVLLLVKLAKALELEMPDLFLASQYSLGNDIGLYKKLVHLLRNLHQPEIERLRKLIKMIFE